MNLKIDLYYSREKQSQNKTKQNNKTLLVLLLDSHVKFIKFIYDVELSYQMTNDIFLFFPSSLLLCL